MDLILKYFPDLTEEQQRQFGQLAELYVYWNERVNVVSRKDIDNLYESMCCTHWVLPKYTALKQAAGYLMLVPVVAFPAFRWPFFFPILTSTW